ncbi:type II secretion system protein [Vibrio metschnikovii]|uniref:MSHA pilin protein MshA n=1 Tax=Vibrio cincinnatiensis DSM 19608 TaxID=1123491 RepID=A0A1T4QFC9_VIBCI|nr:type II secretion system protein [Vibrio cincinnatiensis]EKO3610539.1 type II secretion system protein [Vibrio metschnikovii]EKO3621586.1 type II secretion system protein [Vibrio metschnikovii]EKO3622630.1 type II secretion system protein [Vibrio metschnikovii]EKO3624712.1 type II secretion system protein [Vibrio metschnikovii]EKO3625897.1 type II secretion system protein [Vibrio metschnikovii]
MKKQGGFTLIELVVVIVILGILAVTAAPRFLNLQDDARKASLQGLKGAIDGATGIVYGKAAVQGKETESDDEVDGIKTAYGYPTATAAGIGEAVVGLKSDWEAKVSGSDFVITFKDKDVASAKCYVTYRQATGTAVSEAASTELTIPDDGGC